MCWDKLVPPHSPEIAAIKLGASDRYVLAVLVNPDYARRPVMLAQGSPRGSAHRRSRLSSRCWQLNGLRVPEVTSASIETLGMERGHQTLVITRKGCKVVTIPLAPRTARAIDLAIGEWTEGPIFLAADGPAAGPARRRAGRPGERPPGSDHQARRTPHTAPRAHHRSTGCRVPLRDVQEVTSNADPRTTMRCDRARTSLDRHATHIVAANIAEPPGRARAIGRSPPGAAVRPCGRIPVARTSCPRHYVRDRPASRPELYEFSLCS